MSHELDAQLSDRKYSFSDEQKELMVKYGVAEEEMMEELHKVFGEYICVNRFSGDVADVWPLMDDRFNELVEILEQGGMPACLSQAYECDVVIEEKREALPEAE